ncbi:MAG TPA: HPF/RaiA family ribosome-associated protein [Acidobacteriaceae bacterium]
MEVEFTARQVKVSKELKTDAQDGVSRIEAVLGTITAAALTFRAERHLQIVEIILQTRHHRIVSHGEATTQESALRQALAHAELQAQRFRGRARTRKRLTKIETAPEPPLRVHTPRKAARPRIAELAAAEEPPAQEPIARAPGKRAMAAITVHSFPGKPAVVEPHVLSAAEAIAIRPMTVEEAVKEAEYRDRDLLIFRDPAGSLFVLHRCRDGKMELVEVP